MPEWDTSADLLAEARAQAADEQAEDRTELACDIIEPSALYERARNLFAPSCPVVLVDPGRERVSLIRVLVNDGRRCPLPLRPSSMTSTGQGRRGAATLFTRRR